MQCTTSRKSAALDKSHIFLLFQSSTLEGNSEGHDQESPALSLRIQSFVQLPVKTEEQRLSVWRRQDTFSDRHRSSLSTTQGWLQGLAAATLEINGL